jgi:hypothetical protein
MGYNKIVVRGEENSPPTKNRVATDAKPKGKKGKTMTNREATIVSAYTGYFIGGLGDLYEYLSELIGRPVYTHEIHAVLDKYHSRIRQDFVMLKVED